MPTYYFNGVKDLIHTPLWGLIQEKLEGDLEWRTGRLYNGEISDIRKSRIAWIDDFYKRKSIADYYINYHPNLYGKKLNILKKDCKKLIGLEFIIKIKILK